MTTFGKLAEVCNQFVKRGMLVFVSGTMTADENGGPRIWTKQDGTPATSFELKANEVKFLSRLNTEPIDESLEPAF